MDAYISPLTIFLMFIAILLLFLGTYTWIKRQVKGGLPFSLLMFASSWWAFSIAIESVSLTIENRVLCSQISYVGIVTVAPLWFLFTLEYSQQKAQFIKKVAFASFILPAIYLIFVYTNKFHYLIWTGFSLIGENITEGIIYHHGFLFYVHMIYSYSLLVIGAVILFKQLFKSQKESKSQIFTLLLAMAIPWIANILYVAIPSEPLASVEITPIALSITGLLVVFGIYKFNFLTTVPITNSEIYDNLNTGIIILDSENNIVNFNSLAKEIVGNNLITANDITKIPINSKFIFKHIFSKSESSHIFHDTSRQKWYDIEVSDFKSKQKTKIGSIIFLYDVTDLKTSEKKLEESWHYLSSIIDFLPEFTFVIDKEGRVEIWNKAIEKLTGVKSKDIVGKDNHEYALPFYNKRRVMLVDLVLNPDKNRDKEKLYENLKREGAAITAEIHNKSLGKKAMHLLCIAKAIYDKKGEIIGAIESMRDITGMKKNQLFLKKKNQELSKLNRIMIKRELKMAELKKRIEKYEGKKSKETDMSFPEVGNDSKENKLD